MIAFDVRGHRLLDPDMLDTLVLTIDLVKALSGPRDFHIVPTGAYVTIPANAPAKVIQPDGSVAQIAPGYGGLIRLRPLYAGRYQIDIGDHKELVFANYFDAAESELSVKPGSEGETPFSRAIDLEPGIPVRRIRPISLALDGTGAGRLPDRISRAPEARRQRRSSGCLNDLFCSGF